MICKIEDIVRYEHRDGDNVQLHTHGGCEVVIYKKGSGVVTVDDEEFAYLGSSIAFIPRGKVHFERTYSTTEVRSCVFESDYFELEETAVVTGGKFDGQAEQVFEIFDKMAFAYLNEEKSLEEEALKELLLQALSVLSYVYDGYFNRYSELRLALCNSLKKYIRVNFASNINYEILSGRFGYSYDRLRHIFVEATGMGLKAYQQGVRMAKAKKLLATTDKSIKKIAAYCGYKNEICFINYFTRAMGMSPTKYRKGNYEQENNKTKTFNYTENTD